MAKVDFETIRSHTLSTCRNLVLSISGSKDNRLTKADVQSVFQSEEFTAELFKLFDHDAEGCVWANQLIGLVKFNLRNVESLYGFAFVQLFESCIQLSVTHPGGKMPVKDFHKALACQSSLGGQVFRMLLDWDQSSQSKDTIAVDELMMFISNITASSNRNPISLEDVNRFANAFRKVASDGLTIDRSQFGKLVSSKNKYFIDRAFKIFDRTGKGKVSLDEYTETLNQFTGNNMEGAIKFLFQIYDENNDGCLQEKELMAVMRASMEENGMNFDEQELKDMVSAIWEDAGKKPSVGDKMTYEDLKAQLDRHPGLASGLAESISRWCSPPETKPDRQTKKGVNFYNYWFANRVFIIFMTIFLALNVTFFIWRAIHFSEFKNVDGETVNVYIMLARANGYDLNFNSMMVLIFILRHTITLMRKIGLVKFLPLDQHVFLHKFTGIMIFFQAWFHAIMHFINFGVNVMEDPGKFLLVNKNYTESLIPLYEMPKGCKLENGSQICDSPGDKYSYWDWIFTVKPGLFGLIPGYANVTGIVLIASLTIMVICSMPVVRRSGYFETFYFTHLLYNVYFACLILHAPSCWKWMVAPLTIFAIEMCHRFVTFFIGFFGQSVITEGIVLPSRVTGLVIKKPPNFKHEPGDWVFIKIPVIAFFEWHPFTISSAPEEKDFFTLHIRGVGGWTNKLHEFFAEEYRRQKDGQIKHSSLTRSQRVKGSLDRTLSRVPNAIRYSIRHRPQETSTTLAMQDVEQLPDSSQSGDLAFNPYKSLRRRPSVVRYRRNATQDTAEGRERPHKQLEKPQQKALLETPLRVYVDGPYGAPASNIFRAKHAVLIATGIGVTPFSSILQSIMYKFWNLKDRSSVFQRADANEEEMDSRMRDAFHLTKVDFFWINRDQRAFEWFIHLLSQLEIEQAQKGGAMERFLDMHMYMTSALQKNDMRAIGLQLAMELMHEKSKRDQITGLKARTKAGRPNWDKVFADLVAQDKGDITVFYCGNPALAKVLQEKCEKLGFQFRKEIF